MAIMITKWDHRRGGEVIFTNLVRFLIDRRFPLWALHIASLGLKIMFLLEVTTSIRKWRLWQWWGSVYSAHVLNVPPSILSTLLIFLADSFHLNYLNVLKYLHLKVTKLHFFWKKNWNGEYERLLKKIQKRASVSICDGSHFYAKFQSEKTSQ